MHAPLPFDDLDAFLVDMALPFRVQLGDGTFRDFRGVFDDQYLDAQLGEYAADTSRPRITCKEADVVGVARQDVVQQGVVRHGVTYWEGPRFDVLSVQPDGTGMALVDMAPIEGTL